MPLNLPNILTFSRIVAIPVIIGLMYLPSPLGNWTAFGVYTYACITDFFDGYLARAWHQQSAMGRFLDPIADKLLIAAVLIMLVANDSINGYDGTLEGGAQIVDVGGLHGQVLSLNGSNGFVSIADPNMLSSVSNEITITECQDCVLIAIIQLKF